MAEDRSKDKEKPVPADEIKAPKDLDLFRDAATAGRLPEGFNFDDPEDDPDAKASL